MLASNALTTIERVRRSLGFGTDDSKDEFITEAINLASQVIERFCNRKFGRKEHTDFNAEETDEYMFSQFPVHQILDINNKPVTRPTMDVLSGIFYGHVPKHATIRYIAGYDLPTATDFAYSTYPLPPDVQQACLKLVLHLYEDEETVSIADMSDLKSVDMGDMKVQLQSGGPVEAIPDDVLQLIRPYRKMNL